MPRVKKVGPNYERVGRNINAFRGLLGVSAGSVMECTLLSRGAYYKRLKHPELFRLGELVSIAKRLNVPLEKLLEGLETS